MTRFFVTLAFVQRGPNELLSTAEVAAKLGVTRQRVLELITKDRLRAKKVGRAYVVRSKDVSAFSRLKVGRPSKAEEQRTMVHSKKTTR
jgi:excisionase family DNA binding protein